MKNAAMTAKARGGAAERKPAVVVRLVEDIAALFAGR